MKIEFGNLINDYETAETITYWYDECLKTLIGIFNDSKVNFSIVYEGDFEKVFLINDETFIYTGIIIRKFSSTDFNKIENRSYGNIAGFIREKNYIYSNELLVCALNYCSFKGIHRSIFRNVSRNNITSNGWIGSPEIIVSYPYFSEKNKKDYNACFKYCSEKIKEYDLKRIIKEFKGAPYVIAIYKIENENHEIGYATYCFDKIDRAHQLARRCYSEYLQYCLDFSKKPYKEYLVASCPMNLKISNNFKNIFEKLYIVNGKPIADVKEIYNFISYSLIDVRDNPNPNLKKIQEKYESCGVYEVDFGTEFLANKILKEVEDEKIKPTIFYSFSDGRTKWKSEFLVYQIVLKLYPNQTIYQYHPLFLKTDKGRLSYDIFITGLNIAIEYQGKQHFEAIDFFGGNDSLIDNQRRDKLKKELSIKNGIKLIYINYNENISEKLIKEKINEALNK